MQNKTLLVLSPLAVPDPDGDPLRLPRKYMDGLFMFAELWQGPLTLLLRRASKRDDNLDYISIERSALTFQVRAFPGNPVTLRTWIQSAAIVLTPLISEYVQIPALCASFRVPFVLDADLTPAVQEEILRAENNNPLLRWRRLLWQRNIQHTYMAMVRAAQGIHLHGPAAYNFYAPLNPYPLMYFNTRVRRAMMPTAAQMQARADRLRKGGRLQLVYSGRWRTIKGVLDLPRLAVELRKLGVPFELDIFGGGMLEAKLERAIADTSPDNVRLNGEKPFAELMRFAADKCDLFVCCHRQGDPSATFIEMMSVGLPLIGYDTGGLRGSVTLSGAGWLTPKNNVTALATRIAELDRDRDTLWKAMQAAAEFGHKWSFEKVMEQRIAHLRTIAAESGSEMRGKGQAV